MDKIILLPALLLILGIQTTIAQHLERVAPEQVGMDSRHLMFADEAINRAIGENEIPGAVLAVVRHGKVAYLKAYGNKSVYPDTIPMTTDVIFDMASCSKPMSTAISIMILAEQGKLRMLDAVSYYLPEFRNWIAPDGKEQQTIRIADLMTHTSGLPPYAPTEELEGIAGSPNPDVLMMYIDTCARDFRPQTDFQYSCLNFIALQHIVEKVSGMSLRDFARSHIFDVLGMEHTDYLPCIRDNRGYWMNTDEAHWATGKEDWHALIAPTEVQRNGQVLCGQVHDPLARIMNGGISGNAGVFSCAEDIAVLCAALQNGGIWNGRRILSPQSVKTMRTVPRATATLGRTLGWDSFSPYASNNGDFFSPHTYGHTGYTGTSIIIDPDTDTSVILLINSVHPKDGHSTVRLRSLVANAVASSILDEEGMAPYTEHYYGRYIQFMDEPPVTHEDIVMLGNSLTENGGDWGKRLDMENVINRGISGDEVGGVYARLHQILPGRPEKLFLMIGINDLSHGLPADSIASMIAALVGRIKAESPDTRLYLQSLLPINEGFGRYARLAGKTDIVPQINTQLKAIAKEMKITYIDLFPHFTGKGTNILRPELTPDGLHLNEEGYNIWTKILKKYM